MKKNIQVIVIGFLCFNSQLFAQFTVFGKVSGLTSDTMKIRLIKSDYLAVDTIADYSSECKIVNGKFSFKVPKKGLGWYEFSTNGPTKEIKSLHLFEDVKLSFTNSILDCKIDSGMDINAIYKAEMRKINASNRTKEYGGKLDSLVHFYKNSPVSLLFVSNLLRYWPYETAKSAFDVIASEIKRGSLADELNYEFNNLIIGKTIPNFKQRDINGKEINLYDYRGKIVLVDFWASWCYACREETPFLLNTLKKYKNRGFEVLAISWDKIREKWMKAIIEDQMSNFVNLSSLEKSTDDLFRNVFKISSIPRNFLIDADGTILARDLRGKELMYELKKKIAIIHKND